MIYLVFSIKENILKILIADDHTLFLDGLKLAIETIDENLSIDTANDYGQLLSIIEKKQDFDLILTDLAMPGIQWDIALKKIKNKIPQTPIVILSAVYDKKTVLKAIEIGASGFIPKTSSNNVILSAIRLVISGGVYLPAELLQIAQKENIYNKQEDGENKSPLTPRQTDVLSLIGKGKSNKIIAHELGLSEGTVKLHVTAILKALNVTNRTGAVVAASKLGITDINEEGQE